VQPDLQDRYNDTVKLIAAFRQLPTKYIHELLFTDAKSMNPCYNVLNQLKKQRFITTLEHPYIGGRKGGSTPLVWILDTEGSNLIYGKRSQPLTAINYHTLDIGHRFMDLVYLSRTGRFVIEDYAVEQGAWMKVNGRDLRPDLYVETRMPNGQLVKSFLEIDRSNEREAQIKSKCSDYAYCFSNVDVRKFPEWPRTIWVVPNDLRARQLRRWIGQLPDEEQQLFKVCEKSRLGEMFV
jgi:hypothetical protein